jgi:hypothetical protein
MSQHPPTFDDLVGSDDAERSRLRSVHDLLVAAGPSAELPPELEQAPVPPGTVLTFPRRRFTAIAAATIAAAILLGVGYAIGYHNSPPGPVQTIAMRGPAGASGSLDLLPQDGAGNWPMRLRVSGLRPLPRGQTYTLWLTKGGRLAESCGAFAVATGTTTVPLNAPYRLRQFDAWVVVRTGSSGPAVLSTGSA